MVEEHGISRYKQGCHCTVCRAANAKVCKEYGQIMNVNGPKTSVRHDDTIDLLLEILHG